MFDFVIVGGGSAGCALAARLSENPRMSVLLVEAGMDVTEENAHPDILASYPAKAYFNRDFMWSLTALLGGAQANDPSTRNRARYEQARILGGGSSINGLNANRGSPADYDEWEKMGATGWTWDSVLPYFRKLERDLNFSDEYHGKDGPIAISRYPIEDWSGFAKAAAEVLQKRGLPIVPDQNGKWQDGIMPATVSVDERDRRVSCALAYLTPKVRSRPNLQIMTETVVHRVVFEGTRAVGAEIRKKGGATEVVRGREVIVTCGTIHSPAVLMRSGIGPADELARHGIPVVAAVPGVGRNLLEHPVVSISCYLNRKGRLWKLDRHHTQAHVRFSSRVGDCPSGDMSLVLISRSGWHEIGKRVGSLYFWVNKSYSQGSITLQSADPSAPPMIDFRMLSDPRDLKRLRDAFRFCAEIAMAPELDSIRTKIFPSNYSDRVRKVSSPGVHNAIQMAIFAGMLDGLPPLRSWLIDTLVTSGVTLTDILRDDATLDAYLNKSVVGVWHPVGTCRMGAANDPMAVTSASGLVQKVSGLRICDASAMPTIPCANTNIPTIMLAERMADLIKAEWAQTVQPAA